MSLFACVRCGVVENTALCGIVWERVDTEEIVEGFGEEWKWLRSRGIEIRRRLVCSQCNPEIGLWHGFFERINAEEAGYTQIPGSNYIALR